MEARARVALGPLGRYDAQPASSNSFDRRQYLPRGVHDGAAGQDRRPKSPALRGGDHRAVVTPASMSGDLPQPPPNRTIGIIGGRHDPALSPPRPRAVLRVVFAQPLSGTPRSMCRPFRRAPAARRAPGSETPDASVHRRVVEASASDSSRTDLHVDIATMRCAATPCRARNEELRTDNSVVVHPRWFTGVRYDIELRVHATCFDENEHEARSAEPVDALAESRSGAH